MNRKYNFYVLMYDECLRLIGSGRSKRGVLYSVHFKVILEYKANGQI